MENVTYNDYIRCQ